MVTNEHDKFRQLFVFQQYVSGRKLAMCLPLQKWTKALVWFDDVDISAFHSCVVVDLWQSLSDIYYCLRVV